MNKQMLAYAIFKKFAVKSSIWRWICKQKKQKNIESVIENMNANTARCKEII